RSLGQLQAVALIVAPTAQVHGLPFARLDLHPEQLDEEPQAVVRERRQQLGMADVGEVVDRLRHRRSDSRRSRNPSSSYESPPDSNCSRLMRSRSARSREEFRTSSTRSCSTTAAPSASSTTMSSVRMVAPPTTTGSPIVPATYFVAPRTRTQRAQIGR